MHTQARLPAALAALHNFIRHHDPSEISDLEDDDDDDDDLLGQLGDQASVGNLADGIPGRAERKRADDMRAGIAKAMWDDYRRELRQRGLI
jgi:hypothetical protein